MARKIKETPILTGKDAQRFESAIKANENKRLTDAEHRQIMASYRRFKVVNPAERG